MSRQLKGSRRTGRRGWIPIACVVAIVALAIGLTACGDGGNSNSTSGESTGSAGGSSAGVKTAQEELKPFETPPSEIGIEEPIKNPPHGKSIYYLKCGAPACTVIGEAMTEAAEEFGDSLKIINQGLTVESISSAFNEAVNGNPDAVVWSATGPEIVQQQISKLHERGVPLACSGCGLENTANGTSNPDVDIDIQGNGWVRQNGQLIGDWTIADSEANAKTLYVDFPVFPSFALQGQAIEKRYQELCPDCTFGKIEAEAEDIAKGLPGQVVSYLQQNPDTNYVVLAFNDMVLGVPEALQAAGLSGQAKVISVAGNQKNFEYIETGGQALDVAHSDDFLGWKAVDSLSRLLAGESVATDTVNQLPTQLLTKENLEFDYKTSPSWPGPPDFRSAFRQLWGVQ